MSERLQVMFVFSQEFYKRYPVSHEVILEHGTKPVSFINIVGVNLCELPFERYIHVIVQCHADVQLCNVNIVWSFYLMKSQILNQVHANHFRKKL